MSEAFRDEFRDADLRGDDSQEACYRQSTAAGRKWKKILPEDLEITVPVRLKTTLVMKLTLTLTLR